jgi:hypothetical protein
MIEGFLRAARESDIATLSHHPELVNVRYEGAPALHEAALHGQMETARWLLDNAALMDTREDQFARTPAAWANEKGSGRWSISLFRKEPS